MQKKYTLDTCGIINIQYDDVLMEGISFHGDSKSMNDRYPRPQSNISKVYKHVRYPAFSVWYTVSTFTRTEVDFNYVSLCASDWPEISANISIVLRVEFLFCFY
jgi:hypothetical protein